MNHISLKVLALLALFGITVAGCSPSAQTLTAQPTVAITVSTFTSAPTSRPLPTSAEEYMPIDPAELSFQLKGVSSRSVVGEGGVLETVGGEVEELLCEGKTMELVSHNFDGEFLETKQYGRIKIQFSNSLTSTGFTVWLTPKQKDAISKAFKPTAESKMDTSTIKPQPSAILVGNLESDRAEGRGTISLVVSEDGNSVSKLDIAVMDSTAECSNGSTGTLGFGQFDLPLTGPFLIEQDSFDVRLSDNGKLEGKFTSPTEASGSVDLIVGLTLYGSLHTCDFGTWNWSAKLKQ